MPSAGEVLAGRYRLEEQMDQGAIGPLFRATRADDGATVTVRVAAAVAEAGPDAAQAVPGGAQRASQLQSGCTATAVDAGHTEDGLPFVVYQQVDGMRLSAIAERAGAVPADHVAPVIDGVLQSLSEAHAQGIAHGWLTPSSVYVGQAQDGSEHVLVLDYGMPAQGAAPPGAHLSPERERGEAATPASDLFTVGLLIADLLTGSAVGRRRPEGDPAQGAPLAPQVQSSPLGPVAQRALAPDPSQRYASAAEMRQGLQAAMGGGDAAAGGVSEGGRTMAMPPAQGAPAQGAQNAPAQAMAAGSGATSATAPGQVPATAAMPQAPNVGGPPPQVGGPPPGAAPRPQPGPGGVPARTGPEKKKGGCGPLIAVGVVLVLLGGGGTAAWFVFSDALVPDWDNTGVAPAPTSEGPESEGGDDETGTDDRAAAEGEGGSDDTATATAGETDEGGDGAGSTGGSGGGYGGGSGSGGSGGSGGGGSEQGGTDEAATEGGGDTAGGAGEGGTAGEEGGDDAAGEGSDSESGGGSEDSTGDGSEEGASDDGSGSESGSESGSDGSGSDGSGSDGSGDDATDEGSGGGSKRPGLEGIDPSKIQVPIGEGGG